MIDLYAALLSFAGGHSEKPTLGALVFGWMIGSPWASTIVRLAFIRISRHLLPLRASSMKCSAYCGASKSGLSCFTLTPPMICSAFWVTFSSQSSTESSILWPGRCGSGRVVLTVFLASAMATSRVIPNTAKVLMGYLQACACLAGWRDSLIWGIRCGYLPKLTREGPCKHLQIIFISF